MSDRYNLQASREAAARNKYPILGMLQRLFAEAGTVLEIGSGTGEHAVFFSRHLPHLLWQPSEHGETLTELRQTCEERGGPNLLPPIPLDVAADEWKLDCFDAVFTANTLHILPWPVVTRFFAHVQGVVKPNGLTCVYGPFHYKGGYLSQSSREFDRQLKEQDPEWGIRDFEAVHRVATSRGFDLLEDVPMPANNRILVWQRKPA